MHGHTDRLMNAEIPIQGGRDSALAQLQHAGFCAVVEQLERISAQLDTLIGSTEVGGESIGEALKYELSPEAKSINRSNLADAIVHAFELRGGR